MVSCVLTGQLLEQYCKNGKEFVCVYGIAAEHNNYKIIFVFQFISWKNL